MVKVVHSRTIRKKQSVRNVDNGISTKCFIWEHKEYYFMIDLIYFSNVLYLSMCFLILIMPYTILLGVLMLIIDIVNIILVTSKIKKWNECIWK